MNWFSGNIAEAVALSKAKNAIFVVFSEGTDELSASLASIINDDRIRTKLESNNFVAIKVQSDSEAYTQFAQIYKIVPLPSIFFIGKNGTPIEIVTGVTKTVAELEPKIDGVLEKFGLKPVSSSANASADFIANEKSSTDDGTEVVCEGGVCYKRPKQSPEDKSEALTSPAAASSGESTSSTDIPTEEKLKRAKELLEKKRREKEEEDARLAKERELQRRRIGQDLQNFKQRQEESEMKKLQEERKRDKIEEQATRKRILEQIELDRAERNQRFSSATSDAATKPAEDKATTASTLPPLVSDSSIARIQFKKPDGEIEVKNFGRDESFAVIRTFVEENVIVASGIREFALSTTFPRREFKTEDDAKTLADLGLVPSSVILILPLDKATTRKLPLQTSYGVFAMLTTILWGVVNPILAAFSYVRALAFSRYRGDSGAAKRASEEELNHNDQAKKRVLRFGAGNQQSSSESAELNPAGGPYKRAAGTSSNIHRLHDTKDSDDENNTWNGNSTQQQ